MSTYHEFEGSTNASCQVTIRPLYGGARLKEFGELYGAPQSRQLPAWFGHWLLPRKLRRVGMSLSPCRLRPACNAGPRVHVPAREVFRSFKHAANVYTPSVGSRNGHPHVIVPRPPFRVVESSTAVSARRMCLLPCTPLYLLVIFRRGSWLSPSPRSSKFGVHKMRQTNNTQLNQTFASRLQTATAPQQQPQLAKLLHALDGVCEGVGSARPQSEAARHHS